jgi:hypothetical protein
VPNFGADVRMVPKGNELKGNFLAFGDISEANGFTNKAQR